MSLSDDLGQHTGELPRGPSAGKRLPRAPAKAVVKTLPACCAADSTAEVVMNPTSRRHAGGECSRRTEHALVRPSDQTWHMSRERTVSAGPPSAPTPRPTIPASPPANTELVTRRRLMHHFRCWLPSMLLECWSLR